jgi:hypothetical protein
LKKIAIELGYNDLDSKISLVALQNILIQHPAFSPMKKLTKLTEKYGVNLPSDIRLVNFVHQMVLKN